MFLAIFSSIFHSFYPLKHLTRKKTESRQVNVYDTFYAPFIPKLYLLMFCIHLSAFSEKTCECIFALHNSEGNRLCINNI